MRHGETREAGFTLIELLVVVVVIGILAAIGIPAYLASLNRARQIASVQNMQMVGTALSSYSIDTGVFPLPGGSTACERMDTLAPLLTPDEQSMIPKHDGWGHCLDYWSDGKTSYAVHCYGQNGLPDPLITPATRYQFDLDLEYRDGRFTNDPF